jgi:hypothetical protein
VSFPVPEPPPAAGVSVSPPPSTDGKLNIDWVFSVAPSQEWGVETANSYWDYVTTGIIIDFDDSVLSLLANESEMLKHFSHLPNTYIYPPDADDHLYGGDRVDDEEGDEETGRVWLAWLKSSEQRNNTPEHISLI